MTSIFWIFLIIVMLQPVLRQLLVEAARRRLIAKIEEKRNSRVILMVHREETMSLLGFPIMRYIDVHDSEEVLRAIHLTDPEVPLDIVLHTPGGLVLASLQIASAIRKHTGKVRVFVPHYAMSGGTLIALAADEIVMSEHAVLGPVDPQVGQFPASSLMKLVATKPIKDVDDQTFIFADQAEKATRQVRECVKGLLKDRYSIEKVEEVARALTEGRWTHDYPIMFEEAAALGLHVSKEMPDEFLQLMALYPQPVRRQPTVDYIPVPRHPAPPRTPGAH